MIFWSRPTLSRLAADSERIGSDRDRSGICWGLDRSEGVWIQTMTNAIEEVYFNIIVNSMEILKFNHNLLIGFFLYHLKPSKLYVLPGADWVRWPPRYIWTERAQFARNAACLFYKYGFPKLTFIYIYIFWFGNVTWCTTLSISHILGAK